MAATASSTQSLPEGHASMLSDTQLAQNASPATQVFATAELLEMILLFVVSEDPKTAFLSRRVNPFFNATIFGSITLQRAMFLRCDIPRPRPGIYINPIFDSTGVFNVRRCIEVYNFGVKDDSWASTYATDP